MTLTVAGWLITFGVWFTATHNRPNHIGSALEDVAAMGLAVGGYVFLISLLFRLTGVRSPLFRPRLFACLRFG